LLGTEEPMLAQECSGIEVVVGDGVQEIDRRVKRQSDFGVMARCDVHDTSVLREVV